MTIASGRAIREVKRFRRADGGTRWRKRKGIATIRGFSGRTKRVSRSAHYVICLSSAGYPASLEARKVYLQLVDKDAERQGMIRIIDESGEDYLFPKSRFAPVSLPRK